MGEAGPSARGRKEKWAVGKGTGPRGGEEQAGLGWDLELLPFLPFSFLILLKLKSI
jgi:hypothetical protein